MAKKYNQGVAVSSARFTKAPMGELEFSRMYAEPVHETTFNGGDIVPVYCAEVLPHDTFSIEVEEVIRQATLKVPSMDRTIIDIFAYEVPNRVVNKSWKNVMGENTSSAWVAPKVSLAPLARSATGTVQIPVGSVADYYGYPTQKPLPLSVLSNCHDLKFRGYLEIYNNYFRDQNYQPPVPYSKLNVYNGFLTPWQENSKNVVSFGDSTPGSNTLSTDTVPDGSVGMGAVAKELLGSDGAELVNTSGNPFSASFSRTSNWKATFKPFKANKLHDYFTSVLPSPQKGEQVIVGVGETAPVVLDTTDTAYAFDSGMTLRLKGAGISSTGFGVLSTDRGSAGEEFTVRNAVLATAGGSTDTIDIRPTSGINGTNLVGVADLSQATGISISDLRTSIAVQQVYEILGRGGSRYTEYINSFFELDIDNPFNDIPTCLGHIRRNLDLYQTAQTSASTEDSAQGQLAAFGYTATGGKLFTRTFLEHGYIHIFAVVRHKNIYPALLSRDNFRLNMMDFYQYPLANISEQPVYTREINPFAGNDQIFGYQEAWAEYRMEPDRVSGYMRPGVNLALDAWTLADSFDDSLEFADGEFLESNTQEVVARGTSSVDESAPQFKAKFTFKITKERPMPTYSMAGLDLV